MSEKNFKINDFLFDEIFGGSIDDDVYNIVRIFKGS